MEFIQRLVHTYPKSIVLVTIILTALMGYKVPEISINTDLKSMFPAADPALNTFNRVSERYGGTEFIVLMLSDDAIIDHSSLENIDQLTRRLATIGGVSQVRSITNIEAIRGDGLTIEVGRFMRQVPETETEVTRFREKLLAHDRYYGTLISEDLKHAVILVQLEPDTDQKVVVSKVQALRDQMNISELVYITGSPVLTEEMAAGMRTDIAQLLPFVTIVVVIVLFMGFQSARGVLLPLVVVFISLICTVGFSAWLDNPLSIVSTGLPILLVSVGSAYGIHLLAKYYEVMRIGAAKSQAVSDCIRTVGLAVIMAGITTVVGFSSLGLSKLTITRDFGLFTAFGVGIAFIISVTFLPAILLLLPEPGRYKSAEARRWLDRIFHFISRLVRTHYLRILGVALAVVILSVAVIPRIHPETNYIIFFPRDSEVRQAYNLVNRHFGGSSSLEIIVDTGEKNGIEDPEFLKRMKSFQQEVGDIPLLAHPMSVVDLLEEENKALHQNSEEYNRLPERGIAQYLLLLESDEDKILDDFIDFDHQEARIRVMSASTRSRTTQKTLAKVDSLAEQYFRSHNDEVTITGVPVLGERLMGMILSSQIRSLVSAVVFAFLVTSLLLKSALKGLACSIPIALTVLVNFGVMGWTAVPLDVATSMIASIAVGIGIDYSIHFYTRYQEERRNGSDLYGALDTTIHTVGRANYFNAFAVTSGFLVLIFSTFPPLQTFGLLSSMTMIVSFLGAMILLPALIIVREQIIRDGEERKEKKISMEDVL